MLSMSFKSTVLEMERFPSLMLLCLELFFNYQTIIIEKN